MRRRDQAGVTQGGLFIEGRRRLSEIPGVDAGLEARVLLRRIAGLTDLEVLAYPERPVAPAEARAYRRAVERRAGGVPFSHILGEKEFWSIPLTVGRAVLTPRPETELLVEAVLERAGDQDMMIADIGTGSGALAVALSTELPRARLIATDISSKALAVAAANAARHGLPQIETARGRFYAPLRRQGLFGRLDFIVSNPPYIAEGEWAGLSPEVRDHEPKAALVSGPTGLEALRRLVQGAPEFLKPGGWLILEVGSGQARSVREFFGRSLWTDVGMRKDLRGIQRVVIGRLRPATP